jgi:DNA-binding transcriptional regulator/RsmH inhibitor MraZ
MPEDVKVAIKRIDPQGRIILPPSFRKKAKGGFVLLVELDNKIEVYPGGADLSKCFDSVEVDVENFEDYHALRRELREVRGR